MKNQFKAVSIEKNWTMNLCSDAETVFPLLCPVKEVDWVDGWKDICNTIYTESGFAEEGCIFETMMPNEGRAIWICSKYDRENTEIEYIKHIMDKAVIKWFMAVRNQSEKQSSIFVTFRATSLNPESDRIIEELMESEFPIKMKGLEEGINHYLATGEMKKKGC